MMDEETQTLCVCLFAFQCSSVLPPVGGGAERLGEAGLFAVPSGKRPVGYPRATGTGSDVAAGHDQ